MRPINFMISGMPANTTWTLSMMLMNLLCVRSQSYDDYTRNMFLYIHQWANYRIRNARLNGVEFAQMKFPIYRLILDRMIKRDKKRTKRKDKKVVDWTQLKCMIQLQSEMKSFDFFCCKCTLFSFRYRENDSLRGIRFFFLHNVYINVNHFILTTKSERIPRR